MYVLLRVYWQFTICWQYFPKDCLSRALPTEINTGVNIYGFREWWHEPLVLTHCSLHCGFLLLKAHMHTNAISFAPWMYIVDTCLQHTACTARLESPRVQKTHAINSKHLRSRTHSPKLPAKPSISVVNIQRDTPGGFASCSYKLEESIITLRLLGIKRATRLFLRPETQRFSGELVLCGSLSCSGTVVYTSGRRGRSVTSATSAWLSRFRLRLFWHRRLPSDTGLRSGRPTAPQSERTVRMCARILSDTTVCRWETT